ncbi:MAG: recombinase family protein [Clostridium sp.]|uniref:recombinase family protein n=1 Tax=Clostridium sp. TaxID=1506 RepID=UPI003042372E
MKIAIYSRKSKETDTGESIKNQINMCKDYFNRQYNDCTFETFEDEGFSGGNINRPSFQRMMQLAKHKQFDVITCYKIDRISRNTLDFLTVFEELKSYNVKLVSVTEGFDPSTPAGKMMMSMISSMAEMERMNIAQRVKDNMLELGKMGRWSGGTPPTGYRSVSIVNEVGKKETYLQLIPEYVDDIKLIFSMIAAGHTPGQISKKIGLPNRTISNILINPVHLAATEESAAYLKSIGYKVYGELNGQGFMPYNRRPRVNGKALWNSKDMFVSTSKHDVAIAPAIWIKANRIFKARGTEARPRISPNSFLSHMVKCQCGSNMYLSSGNPNKNGEVKYYFRCSDKKYKNTDCDAMWLPVELVEEKVISTLRKIKLDKKLLDDYVTKNTDIDFDSLIKNVKKDILKKNKDIEKLTDKLILVEGPAINIVTNKINDISNEITELNNNLFVLERKNIFQNLDKINTDTLYTLIVELLIDFDILNIEKQQQAIKRILKEIRYNGEKKVSLVFLGGV